MGRSKILRTLTPYLFLLPSAVFFLGFTLVPIVTGFILSFYKWDVLSPPKFGGVDNFRGMLTDNIFINSIVTTAKFTGLVVPAGIIIGIILAMLVNNLKAGKVIYRSIFFYPVVTSTVALSFVMNTMFAGENGVVNYFLRNLGMTGPNWDTNGTAALIMSVIFIIWGTVGTNMLIFLAGLQGIPDTLYEASNIDGSKPLNTFFKITLPMLTPAIFFVLVISVINTLQIFDAIYALTKGGPGYATSTIVYNIYKSSFINFRMGYASAMSLVLFVFIMIVTAILWKFQDRWVYYDA